MVKIIAEFCQNHNGNFSILTEMVHAAAEAGASYAKIQTIFADDLTFRERFEEDVVEGETVRVIKRPYREEYERLKRLELTYEQQAKFIEICQSYNIIPCTTIFTLGCIKRIKEIGFQQVKLASYDCGSLPLVRKVADNFDFLIISTGASTDQEIKTTADYLNSINKDFSFLHCVTIYPTPLKQVNLNRMSYLKQFTSEIGFSDHTLVRCDGVKASIAAIYSGAKYIERHFTILKEDQTKDGPVSICSKQLKELLAFSKLSDSDKDAYIRDHIGEYEMMKGSRDGELTAQELLNRDYYRGRFASKDLNGNPIYNWVETAYE